jgi:hypothetical protein
MTPPGHSDLTMGERRESERRSNRPSGPSFIPSWAWPLLIAGLMGLGGAKVMLGGKEDASAHASDMADAARERTALKTEVDKATIRDSAWKADAMRILIDLQRRRP